jgi:hypothetical protein
VPALEKQQGHDAEEHPLLHEWIKKFTGASDVDVEGSTQTKTDIITNTGIRFSHKFPSPRNTQVHLPTLQSFNAKFNLPQDVYDNLEMFLGTFDTDKVLTWQDKLGVKLSATELRKRRVHINHLPDFNCVLEYFNKITKNKSLLRYLLQQLRDEDPVQYLIWTSKKQGWSHLIDLESYIDWLSKNAVWEASKGGTTIFVKDNTWTGKRARRLLYMQQKGSGKGDYHAPMFHLYCNWPEQFILEKQTDFWLT